MPNSLSIPPTLAAFENRQVRRRWHNNEWWFSITDAIGAITLSANARRYWSDIKRKIEQEQGGIQLYEKIVQLKLPSADGKFYTTDCANTETMLRIIQSIPSPKAEPFKLWLARIGYDRIREIENPELASQRARELYKAKGCSDDWIEKRLRGSAASEKLADEWNKRGVKGSKECAILAAEISQATFGANPQRLKKLKGLGKQHELRDHMNDLELIFAMLGEAATTEIAQAQDAQGFDKNRIAAIEGGKVAGKARKQLEIQTGRKVIGKTGSAAEQKRLTGGNKG